MKKVYSVEIAAREGIDADKPTLKEYNEPYFQRFLDHKWALGIPNPSNGKEMKVETLGLTSGMYRI